MKTAQFIAPDTATALTQIQEQLGPAAVVLKMRPLPRWWPKKRRIEVVAGLPDETSTTASLPAESNPPAARFEPGRRWQSLAWLQAMGLLPENTARLQQHLDAQYPGAPGSLDEEWTTVSAALNDFWKIPPPLDDTSRPHVFVGPPGSGKTTVLCKWLTLAILAEGRAARVWRLDSAGANTAEFLSVHCEMLGAPVERFWLHPDRNAMQFVDLPGLDPRDRQGWAAMLGQLAAMPKPRVHLVLNAAYETSALLSQCRAFSAFEPEDIIFTHLDEETQRLKLWNFLFETTCGIRFLSAGSKIPGEFCDATPQHLFPAPTS